MSTEPTTVPVLGWHFTNIEGTLSYGDGRQVVIGETLCVQGPIIACHNGLHAGRTIAGAYMNFFCMPNGPQEDYLLWRVRLGGVIEAFGRYKWVASERTALACRLWRRVGGSAYQSHKVAMARAEEALDRLGVKYPLFGSNDELFAYQALLTPYELAWYEKQPLPAFDAAVSR
jgi:hypothetical protein